MRSLVELMEWYVTQHGLEQLDGGIETAIPGVWFYHSRKGNPRQPFTYQSGIITLAQGYKTIHIGDTPVEYGPNDYLVMGVPLPLQCEARPQDGKPLLGLTLNIDQSILHRQVNQLNILGYQSAQPSNKQALGLKSVRMSDAMQDTCRRIMHALCHPYEAQLLGDSLLEEAVFRALTSEEGHMLFELAHYDGHYQRIAKALDKVHSDYSSAMSVDSLAKAANMSLSAFHQAFRNVTLETPIQYIKKVRLNRARELIHFHGKRVNEAARLVGYNSTSQFSREYKRHFNETPRANLGES